MARTMAGLCADCAEWVFWEPDPSKMLASASFKCTHCGSLKIAHRGTAGYAILSQDTFDIERGKKEAAAWRRKYLKK